MCKRATSAYSSTHTKNTLRPELLATVLSTAEELKKRVLNNFKKGLYHIL